MANAIRTTEELRAVLNALHTTSTNTRIIACYVRLQALTGLRYSDLSALTFDSVKHNGKYKDELKLAQIKSTNIRISRGLNEAQAKAKSLVYVSLSTQAHEVLEELESLQGGDGLLFASQARNATGKAISNAAINTALNKAGERAGLTYSISSHSVRKAFATVLMYEHNVSLAECRDRLGHSNIAVTDRYLARNAQTHTAQVQL